MKTDSPVILITLLYAFAAASYGESAYERELKELIDQRDKAIAAAAVPISSRFKASAEQLLQRATRNGDLDAATKIKAAIAADTAPDKPSSTRDFIKNTVWGWFFPDGKKYGTVKLEENGKVTTGLPFPTRWEWAGAAQFKIFDDKNGFWVFHYDPATKEATNIKFAGGKSEGKFLRPESK
ncbi:MAG: hypothetical protein ABMA13_11115 [Chthoniobacteraceae bacterium]